ncbi:MetQ/NlpA family ABC transporter substrate-binding protein [Nocardia fusca]|uniref:MetQ/NlpA family ABC transporter substrate-binding protein n=1 Tax=Nocardia fusca TaxID=941183 RepID=UPI0037C74A03
MPVLLASAALLPAWGTDRDPGVVRIGVNDLALPHWEVYREKAAERGITVEFVNFSDYNQPNPALSQGRIDLNKFQHVRYLTNYNDADNDDSTPAVATAIRAESGYDGSSSTTIRPNLRATVAEAGRRAYGRVPGAPTGFPHRAVRADGARRPRLLRHRHRRR